MKFAITAVQTFQQPDGCETTRPIPAFAVEASSAAEALVKADSILHPIGDIYGIVDIDAQPI